MLAAILAHFSINRSEGGHPWAIEKLLRSNKPSALKREAAQILIKEALKKYAAIVMINLAENFSGLEARCFHEELLCWAVGSGSLRYAQLYAAHLGRELTREEAQQILETLVFRNSIQESDIPAFASLGVLPVRPSAIEHYVKNNLKRGLKVQTVSVLGHLGLTLDDFNLSSHEMRIYECAAAASARC